MACQGQEGVEIPRRERHVDKHILNESGRFWHYDPPTLLPKQHSSSLMLGHGASIHEETSKEMSLTQYSASFVVAL